MLTVGHQHLLWTLLPTRADSVRWPRTAVLPQEEIASRVAPVPRIEQVPNLDVRPHERPLLVRESDLAELDLRDQALESRANIGEECRRHCSLSGSPGCLCSLDQ